MKKKNCFCLMLAFIMATPAFAADKLYDRFESPPASARPFVRWWWNGNCPTEHEVLRELDVMKAAGIGGVEINPIAMPGGQQQFENIDAKPLVWLSDEWNRIVKATCDAQNNAACSPTSSSAPAGHSAPPSSNPASKYK